jgi:hypothetical protein
MKNYLVKFRQTVAGFGSIATQPPDILKIFDINR